MLKPPSNAAGRAPQREGSKRETSKRASTKRGSTSGGVEIEDWRTAALKNGGALQKRQEWRKKPVENVQFAMEERRQQKFLEVIKNKDKQSVDLHANPLSDTAGEGDTVKQVALENAPKDRYALIYAGPDIKGDKECMLKAVACDGNALQYASQELRADYDVVLVAAKQNGDALRFADARLIDEREIALAAVSSNGKSLRRVSERLRDDFDVVLAAVQQDGRALRFASEDLKGDRDIAFAATRTSSVAYAYVPPGAVKKELEEMLESSWGLPIIREGCIAGQSLTYRDCTGVWRYPSKEETPAA